VPVTGEQTSSSETIYSNSSSSSNSFGILVGFAEKRSNLIVNPFSGNFNKTKELCEQPCEALNIHPPIWHDAAFMQVTTATSEPF
jgi:hypothetical protein